MASKKNVAVDELDELDELDDLDDTVDGDLDGLGDGSPDLKLDLSSLDLSQVVSQDNRLLPDKTWIRAKVVSSKPGLSKKGNLQIVFHHQVTDDRFVDDQGVSLEGVTVRDQCVVDRSMPDCHFAIKRFAEAVGKMGDNGKMLVADCSEFVGLEMEFFNKHNPYNDEIYNSVGNYRSLKSE